MAPSYKIWPINSKPKRTGTSVWSQFHFDPHFIALQNNCKIFTYQCINLFCNLCFLKLIRSVSRPCLRVKLVVYFIVHQIYSQQNILFSHIVAHFRVSIVLFINLRRCFSHKRVFFITIIFMSRVILNLKDHFKKRLVMEIRITWYTKCENTHTTHEERPTVRTWGGSEHFNKLVKPFFLFFKKKKLNLLYQQS